MRSVRTVILGLALACISGPGWGQAETLKEEGACSAGGASLLADAGASGSATGFRDEKRPRIVKEGKKFRFLRADGTTAKELLNHTDYTVRENVALETGEWKLEYSHDTGVRVERSGEHAAYYIRTDGTAPDGKHTARTLFQVLDATGAVLWELRDRVFRNVSYRLSETGGILLVVEEDRTGAKYDSVPDEPRAAHFPIVYDLAGRRLMELGTYDEIVIIHLTPNGRYGYILYQNRRMYANDPQLPKYEVSEQPHGTGLVFFDVERRATHTYRFPNGETPSYPDIDDHGRGTVVMKWQGEIVYEFSFAE